MQLSGYQFRPLTARARVPTRSTRLAERFLVRPETRGPIGERSFLPPDPFADPNRGRTRERTRGGHWPFRYEFGTIYVFVRKLPSHERKKRFTVRPRTRERDAQSAPRYFKKPGPRRSGPERGDRNSTGHATETFDET